MALIKLHHKMYEGLAFGPNNEIQFGLKAGLGPGIAIVDDEHPLYAALWELEGSNLEVVDESGPARVYVSPFDPDKEFKSKPALMAHIGAVARGTSGMAKAAQAWLKRYKGDDVSAAALDEAEASPVATATHDDYPASIEGDGSGVHRSRDGVIAHEPVSPPAFAKPA